MPDLHLPPTGASSVGEAFYWLTFMEQGEIESASATEIVIRLNASVLAWPVR